MPWVLDIIVLLDIPLVVLHLSFDIQISSRNNRDVIVFAFILSLVGRTRDGQLAGSGFT